MNKYIKKLVLMIPYVKKQYENVEKLRSQVDSLEAEVNRLRQSSLRSQLALANDTTYHSCVSLEEFHLYFNGRIDTGEKCLSLCCEPTENIPGLALYETAEESVKKIAVLREQIIEESIRLSLQGIEVSNESRRLSSDCTRCAEFKLKDWSGQDGLIHYINMSMYPAPCQSKCIYCFITESGEVTFDKQLHKEGYEKVFDIITLAQKKDMISDDALWQISTGEITIHPFRDRIFSLVKDKKARFFTNCFIYSEHIAGNLASNPSSSINFSIDCGTPETWHKIKGIDNFDTVIDNLKKYRICGVRPSQIILKYIVLPGINDNPDEYLALIEIMNVMGIEHLCIARDAREKYLSDEDSRQNLIDAAGTLVAVLYRADMTMDLTLYLPDECEKILAFAEKLR